MAQSQMTLSLFSQRITTPKSNALSLAPKSHKKNHISSTIKAESGNLDHLQRASIKTPQQKQPIKKRVVQSPPIGLWDRYPTARTVQQMMDTMETLMDDQPSYRGVGGSAWGSQGETTSSYSRGRTRTPWEIKESEQDYKMRFDMPGMTKEDVKVWVEETMLVLKAEKLKKDNNSENNKEAIDDKEWSYGKYSFRIALPENIQFEKIKAEVKDGVLYVTIPKAPLALKILDINVQ